MATFHPFPRLPFELRAMVWALAAEPRIVQIKGDHDESIDDESYYLHPTTSFERLVSATPVPAVLHACRESRQQSSYEKLSWSSDTGYVWVNLDLDMLDVDLSDFYLLYDYRPRVRRLKFQYDEVYGWWSGAEDFEYWEFDSLVECHVVVIDLRECARLWDEDFLPSKRGNFLFIDKETGEMMNSCDLDDMLRRLRILSRVYRGV